MRTIGLDVGKSFAEVAVIEAGGHARPAGRIATSPEGLRAFAASLGPDDQVVLEATTNTWAIAELLAAHAGRVVVSNPIRTRAIADAKTKTDTIDAATLAELLAADYLPEVWQPDQSTQALRRRLAGRAALVDQRRRLRNRISAILARNLRSSPWSDPFGVQGLRWLVSVELPADEREQVDAALRLLTGIEAEIRRAEAGLAGMVIDDLRVRRLLTIPGIGPVASLGLLAAIGTSLGSLARTSSSATSAWIPASASLAAARRISGTSAGPVRGMPARSSSRPPMRPSARPVPCGPSMPGWRRGADPASPPSRSPASSRSWPGTCSTTRPTTAGRRRAEWRARCASSSGRPALPTAGAASSVAPPAAPIPPPSAARCRRSRRPTSCSCRRGQGRTRPPPTGCDSMARGRLRGGAQPHAPRFATGSTASGPTIRPPLRSAKALDVFIGQPASTPWGRGQTR